jgi:alkyl hydroperoxide reductase subunit AhpC
VAYEVTNSSVGRDAAELLRRVQACQYVADHGEQVCPANWHPGDKTLTPGLDLAGKL